MRRYVFAICAVNLGCIGHRDSPVNAPGHVALEQPPKDLAVRAPEPPTDPGETATIVTSVGTPLGVGFAREGTYLPFSIEFAASRHTMVKSHRGMVSSELLDGAIRPNLGLTFLRVFPKNDTVRFGPMFLELQYVGVDRNDKFWSGTFALGVATTFKQVGPQATACIGTFFLFDLCARTNYLFGEGASLQFTLGYQGAYESIASR